jgi:hypothetical protein
MKPRSPSAFAIFLLLVASNCWSQDSARVPPGAKNADQPAGKPKLFAPVKLKKTGSNGPQSRPDPNAEFTHVQQQQALSNRQQAIQRTGKVHKATDRSGSGVRANVR